MLWFLDMAAQAGWAVDLYDDAATGSIGKDAEGRLMMTKVVLHPLVTFRGSRPSTEALAAMHDRAHEACFLANLVKTTLRVEPRDDSALKDEQP